MMSNWYWTGCTNTMLKEELTQEIVKEYLDYAPATGILTWLKKPCKRTVVNTRAGTEADSGYRYLSLFGKRYPEHHVVWFWVHGYWPSLQIDHIDQNRSNNALHNLREVTKAENARNRSRRRNTKVEEAGIWYCRKRQRYVSEITVNGKKVYQKTFKAEDINAAIRQRKQKLIELGFHENHGS